MPTKGWQHAQLAAQYYLSARFAAVAGLVPVAGNLMHHAIELLCKCVLIRADVVPNDATLDKVMKETYKHWLAKLWPKVKLVFAMRDLSKFDAAVTSLDQWDSIRYPRSTGSIAMRVSFAPDDATGKLTFNPPADQTYDMHVPTLDAVFHELWTATGLSHDWLKQLLRTERPLQAEVYETMNPHHF